MNKKSIGALLLSAALLMGGTAATFAYFTDTASSGVMSFKTGNVDINIDNGTQWALTHSVNEGDRFFPKPLDSSTDKLDKVIWRNNNVVNDGNNLIKNLAPGDVITKSFTVTNAGSLDSKVKVYLTDKDGNKLDKFNWWDCSYNVYLLDEKGNQVDCTNSADVLIDQDNALLLIHAKHDTTMTVQVNAWLSPLIDNNGKNTQFDFKVKADATQWNNKGWDEQGK
ncbi:CalY family protein [Clostridium omnivorum]|uniref:Camelysin metallo-endopeptidase n=1 Tax=Clostridium omnivorum TaxID=1604902 RepID=A0ABQ5N5W1_9CLOT|nr:CalY family protein [Clostridium sp. E14]GLC30530.1 hypothetical protein bsdE14_19400 [Clostridium sp. E14]